MISLTKKGQRYLAMSNSICFNICCKLVLSCAIIWRQDIPM